MTSVTPYGDTDELLSLLLDIESDAYALKNVIKLIGTYTFSIWHKSDKENTITFNFFGKTEETISTTEWKKYTKTITVSSLDDTDIYIKPGLNVNTFLYEAFLSEGTLDTSWTPAPEDVDDSVLSVRSELSITADEIKNMVSANDGRIAQLITDLNGIYSYVKDSDENIGKLEVTANQVKAEVENARGDSASLSIALEGIKSSVVDVDNRMESSIQQSADEIKLYVKEMNIGANNLILNSDFSNMSEDANNEDEEGSLLEETPIVAKNWVLTSGTYFNTTSDDYFNNYAFIKCSVVDSPALLKQEFFASGGNHKEDKKYTLSFYAKCSSESSIKAGHENGEQKTFELTTEWSRFYFSYDSSSVGGLVFELPYCDFDFYITHIQLEYGEILSEWRPAVEDLENEFNDKYSSIEVAIDDISSVVSESEDKYSKISQESEKIVQEIRDATGAENTLSQTLEALESKISDNSGKYSSLQQTTDGFSLQIGQILESIRNIDKHFIFDQNGITIMSGDSPLRLRLDNNHGIQFLNNETPVATMTGQNLEISNADIFKSIQIGNFAFVPKTNGSLSFKKIK